MNTVHTFIDDVEESLRDALSEQRFDSGRASRIMSEAARHLTLAPAAKRARPQVVFHFGRAVDAPREALVDAAVAAEFVHTASLLHDDVIDEATRRRGREATNWKWNNNVAILSGDLLLCLALERLEHYDRQLTVEAVDVVREMTRGIMCEIETRRCVDMQREDWRTIAEGKTAVLFGWCGSAAALLGGDPDAARAFRSASHHLGVAFQLADDLKDLYDGASGKNRFSDIRNGHPSYPLILAMERSDRVRERLAELWQESDKSDRQDQDDRDDQNDKNDQQRHDDEDIERLGLAVMETDVAAATRSALIEEIDQARRALDSHITDPHVSAVFAWAQTLAEQTKILTAAE